MRALTRAQLAATFQEDADFFRRLLQWLGERKRHVLNIPRAKQGSHEVIVYCKANPDTKVVDVKNVQAGGQ